MQTAGKRAADNGSIDAVYCAQNFVYAIGDRTTSEAVVIDACWDVDGAQRKSARAPSAGDGLTGDGDSRCVGGR